MYYGLNISHTPTVYQISALPRNWKFCPSKPKARHFCRALVVRCCDSPYSPKLVVSTLTLKNPAFSPSAGIATEPVLVPVSGSPVRPTVAPCSIL